MRTGGRAGAIAAVALALGALAPSVPADPSPFAPPYNLKDYDREVKAAINAVSEKELKKHAFWLAGDAQQGRECGTLAGHRVAKYLVAHYRALGLKSATTDGSYLQWFPLRGASPKRGKLDAVNTMQLAKKATDKKKASFVYKKDLLPLKFSGDGNVAGTVVFAGYGIHAPDNGYDDYAGIKVADKIVLVLHGGPQGDAGPFGGGEAAVHTTAHRKAEVAQGRGALGLLLVGTPDLDPSEPPGDGPARWPPTAKKRVDIPCVLLSMRTADAIFKLGGKRRTGVQSIIDKKLIPASAGFKRAWVTLNVAAEGPQLGMGANVCAIFPATAKDKVDEYIVVGAHRDHIGFGRFGGGRAGQIHNGADDNASGTSGLLELARVLVKKKVKLRRHLMILHFDGEEKGLLGSRHYASAPLVPMKQTVAMLNMDMIGRNATNQMMCGPPEDDRNPALHRILLKISSRFRIALPGKGMGQYMKRSDQWPFMQKGVPAIFLFGGMHGDYHKPGDDPHKLNFTKMGNIAKLILLFAVEVAELEDRP